MARFEKAHELKFSVKSSETVHTEKTLFIMKISRNRDDDGVAPPPVVGFS
jgi:hypothetical protein